MPMTSESSTSRIAKVTVRSFSSAPAFIANPSSTASTRHDAAGLRFAGALVTLPPTLLIEQRYGYGLFVVQKRCGLFANRDQPIAKTFFTDTDDRAVDGDERLTAGNEGSRSRPVLPHRDAPASLPRRRLQQIRAHGRTDCAALARRMRPSTQRRQIRQRFS